MAEGQAIEQFLRTVITTPEGFFCMLTGDPATETEWHDRWYHWPQDVEEIVKDAIEFADHFNVYFCAHLFKERSSAKTNVLPTRTIIADLDEADVSRIALAPTALVETSPGRHQGFWILKETESLTPSQLETLSRRLTYSIPDCDKSGWSLGHKVRMPGTLNYKYAPSRPVKVISIGLRRYSREDINEHTREVEAALQSQVADEEAWETGPHDYPIGPQELFESIRTKLRRSSITAFTTTMTRGEGEGRSGALWSLMLDCLRAGLDRDAVFWIAKHSANNKFDTNKWHGDLDLAKDVTRAIRSLKTGTTVNPKELINEVRRAQGLVSEKRAAIAHIVITELEKHGEFVVTQDNQMWFLDRNTGRPILVSRASEFLDAILEVEFGLNATEPETRSVVKSLQAFTVDRGRTARSAVLSYTDGSSLLLHGGRKDIFQITANNIDTLPNGAHGVLFPWRTGETSFVPAPITQWDWIHFMFEGHFKNAIDHDPEEVFTLLRVWLLFMLFRDEAINRPVLALFGQPGSGKSTTFRLIYTLLYGPQKAVNAVTSQDNFDYLVSTDPVVVLDNVDTWAGWLPDRIALSAANSDLIKRKLYTDADTVSMKRQALLGITAHNPKFGREDVVDRMLLLNFERLQEFGDEAVMIKKVNANRDRIWGGIVADIQAILKEPWPPESEIPTFRISDFARIGYRIAKALGIEDSFRRSLTTTRTAQTAFNLSEEDILIDAIQRWHTQRKSKPEGYLAAGSLWEAWSPYAPGFERHYRNALQLGKKLQTLQETLATVFDIDTTYDRTRGVKLWKIEPKAATPTAVSP